MTAGEVFEIIRYMGGAVESDTVDTCKEGDLSVEVDKLAVCFIATPQVIREAKAWGAQMVLTHEPTYYTNDDTADNDPITLAKKRLVEDAGMVICRFHDGLHNAESDRINTGFAKMAALQGVMLDKVHFELETPLTARELAERCESAGNMRCVRIVGDAVRPLKILGLYLGAPWGEVMLNDLKSGASDAIVTGEVCEWSVGEYVRDAAQLGISKAMLILGHVGSERDGMRLLATELQTALPVKVAYFECGELYE